MPKRNKKQNGAHAKRALSQNTSNRFGSTPEAPPAPPLASLAPKKDTRGHGAAAKRPLPLPDPQRRRPFDPHGCLVKNPLAPQEDVAKLMKQQRDAQQGAGDDGAKGGVGDNDVSYTEAAANRAAERASRAGEIRVLQNRLTADVILAEAARLVGLLVWNVNGDGNCFFSSVSLAERRAYPRHQNVIRQECAKVIGEMRSEFALDWMAGYVREDNNYVLCDATLQHAYAYEAEVVLCVIRDNGDTHTFDPYSAAAICGLVVRFGPVRGVVTIVQRQAAPMHFDATSPANDNAGQGAVPLGPAGSSNSSGELGVEAELGIGKRQKRPTKAKEAAQAAQAAALEDKRKHAEQRVVNANAKRAKEAARLEKDADLGAEAEARLLENGTRGPDEDAAPEREGLSPQDAARVKRSADAQALMNSTDPAPGLEGCTKHFEEGADVAAANLFLGLGIHLPGFYGLAAITNGTCSEEDRPAALESARQALVDTAAKIKRAAHTRTTEYLEKRSPVAEVLSCASCGMRLPAKDFGFQRIPLQELGLLKFNGNMASDRERRRTIGRVEGADAESGVPYRQVYSYYEHTEVQTDGSLAAATEVRDVEPGGNQGEPDESQHLQPVWYHLHREFVDVNTNAMGKSEHSAALCGSCAAPCLKWNAMARAKARADAGFDVHQSTDARAAAESEKARPRRSVAAGVDFGHLPRLKLQPLRPLEWQVLARARLYMSVVKISGANAGSGEQPILRGQCIAFEQEGALGKVKEALAGQWRPPEDLSDYVSVAFVGSNGQYEKRMSAALPFGSILSNPRMPLILKYARAFKALGLPGYEDVSLDDDAYAAAHTYYADPDGEPNTSPFLSNVYAAARAQVQSGALSNVLIRDVDTLATSADPSGAQQQADAIHGEGPPTVADNAAVVLEDVFLGTNSNDEEGDGVGVNELGGEKQLRAALALFVQGEAPGKVEGAATSALDEDGAECGDPASREGLEQPDDDGGDSQSAAGMDVGGMDVDGMDVDGMDGDGVDGDGMAVGGVDGDGMAVGGVDVDGTSPSLAAPPKAQAKIPRSVEPMNEFTENNKMIVGLYPAFFPTGTGPLPTGSFKTVDCRHLLLQFDPEIGRCAPLVFLLFNQHQRHAGTSRLAAAVKNDAPAFVEFRQMVEDPDTVSVLRAAVTDRETPEARAIIKKLERIVSVTGGFVPFSAAARKSKLGHFIAIMRHFGYPAFFNTVSPDPIADVPAMRSTMPTSSNTGLPAQDDGYLNAVRAGANASNDSSTKTGDLMRAATVNAVRMAEGYNTDVRMLYSVLLGMAESSENRRTAPQHETDPGIFGDTIAAMSVTECNGKGWNHLHQLLYAMLPSWILQAAAGDQQLHGALALVVDACVCTELPAEIQLQSLLASLHGFYHHRGPWHTERAAGGPDDPEFKQHAAASAERVGLHATHGSRCRKGFKGDKRCSQCYSRGIRPRTLPVCLGCDFIAPAPDSDSESDEEKGDSGKEKEEAPSDPDAPPPNEPKAVKKFPLEAGDIPVYTPGPSSLLRPLAKDSRLLVVEPQRAKIPIDENETDYYGRVMRAPYAAPTEGHMEAALGNSSVSAALRRLVQSRDGDDPPERSEDGGPAMEHSAAFVEGRTAAALLDLKTAHESGRLAAPSSLRVLIEALPSKYVAALKSALRDRNKKVADHNPTLTALRGCNTAIYPLSGEAAAKAALFYILKYMTKDPTEQSCTLSLALAAKDDIEAHPSKADDTGTDKRTAQHFLNRLMNKKHGLEEVSMMLASSCLIGLCPEPVTHNATPLNVAAAIEAAKEIVNLAGQAGLMEPTRLLDDAPPGDLDSDSETGSGDESGGGVSGLEDDEEEPSSSRRSRHKDGRGTVKPDFINGRPVLPSIVTAYANRPSDFLEYSLYMFFCVCEVALRKKNAPDGASSRSLGREANRSYDMEECNLSATHVIKIRSKVILPRLFPPPPPYPNFPPKEKKTTAKTNNALRAAAHKFGQYALVLHCPWDSGVSPPVGNWEQFVEFTRELREQGSVRARSILHWVRLLADGLAPDETESAKVMQYRARNSDKWEHQGNPAINPEVLFHRPMRARPDTGADGDMSEARRRAAEEAINGHVGKAREITNVGSTLIKNDAAFCRKSCLDLAALFGGEPCTVPPTNPDAPAPAAFDEKAAESAYKALKANDPPPPPPAVAHLPRPPGNLAEEGSMPTLLADQCNAEQKVVVDWAAQQMLAVAEWRRNGAMPKLRPKQGLKLIHGGPGAGKSFVISALDETAAGLGVTHPKMCFMASAANLIGGRTIHGAAGFAWRDAMVGMNKTRKQNQVSTIWAIIIDEISAVDWALFLKVDKRYRELMQCPELPFGGLTVLIFGDFFQLPPPRGDSLFEMLIKTQVHLDTSNRAMVECSNVFKQFEKMELVGNMRARDDADWAAFIKSLRDPAPGRNPIEDHLLPRLPAMVLTEGDIALDPTWSDAPICVCGNRHRMALLEARAKSIAKRLGVPVIRWRNCIAGKHAEALVDEQLDILYDSDPRLTGYFIQGFGGYLNQNVKPERRVSNGSPFTYHSLTLGKKGDDSDDADRDGIANDEARMCSGSPGEFVDLSAPPFSVNIKLHLHQDVDRGEYGDVSLVQGEAVIPVLVNHTDEVKSYIQGLGVVTLELKTHGADVAVAATFYKAQGRTMARVLACLNSHPSPPHLSYEAVFVFLSRVKFGLHCKVLPLKPGGDWDHLKKLRPSAKLVAYLGGFGKDGSWCAGRARAHFDAATTQNAIRDAAIDKEKKKATKAAKLTAAGPTAARPARRPAATSRAAQRAPAGGASAHAIQAPDLSARGGGTAAPRAAARLRGSAGAQSGDPSFRPTAAAATNARGQLPLGSHDHDAEFGGGGDAHGAQLPLKKGLPGTDDGKDDGGAAPCPDVRTPALVGEKTDPKANAPGPVTAAVPRGALPPPALGASTRASIHQPPGDDMGESDYEYHGTDDDGMEESDDGSGDDDAAHDGGSVIWLSDDDPDRAGEAPFVDGVHGVVFPGVCTREETDAINVAQHQRANAEIVTISAISLRGKDFHRLIPGQTANLSYLNDELINATAFLLQRRDVRFCEHNSGDPSAIYTSYFMPKLEEYFKKKATFKRFCTRTEQRNPRTANPFNLSWLYIPINQSPIHWMLLAADMKNKRVYFFNSTYGGNRGNVYYTRFMEFLEIRAGHHGLAFNRREWNFTCASPENPQQTNGYDCGVFVLMGIYYLSAGLPWNGQVLLEGRQAVNFRLFLTHCLLRRRIN